MTFTRAHSIIHTTSLSRAADGDSESLEGNVKPRELMLTDLSLYLL